MNRYDNYLKIVRLTLLISVSVLLIISLIEFMNIEYLNSFMVELFNHLTDKIDDIFIIILALLFPTENIYNKMKK